MFTKIKTKIKEYFALRKIEREKKRVRKALWDANYELINTLVEMTPFLQQWHEYKKEAWFQDNIEILKNHGVTCPLADVRSTILLNLLLWDTTCVEQFSERYNNLNKTFSQLVVNLYDVGLSYIASCLLVEEEDIEDFIDLIYEFDKLNSAFAELMLRAKELNIPTSTTNLEEEEKE